MSEVDLVVEIVFRRWLGDDRIEADAVDGFALVLGPGALDFSLVPGPVVAVAESVFERVPIRPIKDHRLAVLEMQHVFFLGVRSVADLLLGQVRDHGDTGALFHIGGF